MRSFAGLLCFAIAFGAIGCGSSAPGKLTVSGSVTLDGKPLDEGSINFIPTDKTGATSGAKIVKGSYTTEVPSGEKRVEITAVKVVGEVPAYDDPASPKKKIFEALIPRRYNVNSELKAKIEKNSVKHDFKLESDKPSVGKS